MRKVFFFAALAVMAAVNANAQGFEWGVKAGVNSAWLTENYTPMETTGEVEVKNRVGFYAGVFAEQVFNKWLGVQGELLYLQMGDRARMPNAKDLTPGSDIEYGEIRFGNKFDYIALPVLAKLYVWKGLSIDAGPQFGYMVSAKYEDESDWVGNDAKKFDVSIVAGLSYKIAGRFDVTARLNFGLKKLYREPYGAKNRAYSLGVGYRF